MSGRSTPLHENGPCGRRRRSAQDIVELGAFSEQHLCQVVVLVVLIDLAVLRVRELPRVRQWIRHARDEALSIGAEHCLVCQRVRDTPDSAARIVIDCPGMVQWVRNGGQLVERRLVRERRRDGIRRPGEPRSYLLGHSARSPASSRHRPGRSPTEFLVEKQLSSLTKWPHGATFTK